MRRILFTPFLTLSLIVIITLKIYPQNSQKVVCITVDDLPFVTKNYINNDNTGKYITDKLLTAFRKYKVVTLGSVNSGKLIVNDIADSNRIKFLNQWLDSGMTLGNHTFAHKNYNNLFFSEFKYDILDGELYLKDILAQKNLKLKYFRHPHLYRGDTREKADSLQHFLDSLGYIIAPVTIDNSDYVFSWAYEKALSAENDSLAKRIGGDYISYMSDVLDYYENQSIAILGYNIKQILLTHADMLNADYMDNLLKMFSDKGYSFISIEEALKDKCYTECKDEFYKKPGGISWLHRWAYTMGKRGDFYKGEPEVPEYINELIK
jgi:peptidoglycan/xylan/chitin deacetylase (PgdA/CDA1 family)